MSNKGSGVPLSSLFGLEQATGNNLITPGFGLAGLIKYQTLTGLWYHNTTIPIDGYKFINCRFDNCVLQLSSAMFEFENCYLDNNTYFVYDGEVIRAVQAFNFRNETVYTHAPSFAPIRNPDGTITIK